MNQLKKFLGNEKRVRSFLISYYLIGLVGMAIPFTKPLFEQLTGVTILISFLLMMVFHVGWNLRFILIALLIAVAGFMVEVAGVKTGWVFGHYSYNMALGPKCLGTPLLIGINWLMLVYCFHILVTKLKVKPAFIPAVGAGGMLAYDILLEPVAITWNMWNWHEGAVPLQNYLAWFLISLVFLALIQLFKLRFNNKFAMLILMLQSGLFLLLNFVRLILYT